MLKTLKPAAVFSISTPSDIGANSAHCITPLNPRPVSETFKAQGLGALPILAQPAAASLSSRSRRRRGTPRNWLEGLAKRRLTMRLRFTAGR
jgi:hypothetical protein